MPVAQIESVLRAWQERMEDLARDLRLQSMIVFRTMAPPPAPRCTTPTRS
jgi:galactose-1-phosphate uridylyltransferase